MNERGGIIIGGLMKIAIFFAVAGFLVFQAGAVVVAKVQVDGIAADAASDAASEYDHSGSELKAREVAEHTAEIGGAYLTGFTVLGDRNVVRVTVAKRAKAFVLERIGPLKKYAVETATHESTIR